MKSTRIAAALLLLVSVFVTWNGIYVSSEIGSVREMASLLPKESTEMKNRAAEGNELCRRIAEKWDAVFPYLTYVCSYQELNRADDAVLELTAAFRDEQYEDAAAARGKLLDAIRRLAELEGLTFGGIF